MFSLHTLIALALLPFVIVFVHELGHAAFALWATEAPVYLSVGREPPLVRARLARLELALHPFPADRGRAGFARVRASLTWDDHVAFALAGPVANIVLALALAPFMGDSGRINGNVALYAGSSLCMAVYNLFPFRRHGHRSDGLVAIEAWRRRSPQPRASAKAGSSSPARLQPARDRSPSRGLELPPQAADSQRVRERCRYCGSPSDRVLVLAEGERACPTCAGSPLCDRCGHPRSTHVGVFTSTGRSCRHVWEEFQTGVRVPCRCEGFAPVVSELRDATFVDRELTDELPPLRLA